MCCGGGGGVMEAYPEFALHTADHRLEEAEDIGVEAVVSACPYCDENFARAAEAGGRRIKVYDVVQLLHESLTGKGGL